MYRACGNVKCEIETPAKLESFLGTWTFPGRSNRHDSAAAPETDAPRRHLVTVRSMGASYRPSFKLLQLIQYVFRSPSLGSCAEL